MRLSKPGIAYFAGNDIVYKKADVSIYANGCLFNCPHCHSKQANTSEGMIELSTNEVIKQIKDSMATSNFTVCYLGGDFFFQMDSLKELSDAIKLELEVSKQIFFTGAEEDIEIDHNTFFQEYKNIDCIIAGREVKLNKIQKKIITRNERSCYEVNIV